MAAHEITYIGTTNGRPPQTHFGIKQADRLLHMYVIGKTGVGKTSLLETMLKQDVDAKRGFALIDPHGDVSGRIAAYAQAVAPDSLIYLNAPDPQCPYGYNPLRAVSSDRIPLAASGLLETLKKRFADAWGVRMEHVLRNVLFALLEYGTATMPDILRMVSDKDFAKDVAKSLSNIPVKTFWQEEFPAYSKAYQKDAIAPIQNKIGAFLSDPVLARLVTTAPQDIHLRAAMDTGKMVVVNLGKGIFGEDSASLLGALLVSTIGHAAFSRADTQEDARQPFMLYIDEFQTMTTRAIAGMVSELRKYKVGLVLAHQNVQQLDPEVRHAVLGNMGTIISFRLGPEDAPLFAREFAPEISAEDLLHLPNHTMYLKLMIDGAPTRVFSGDSLGPGWVR
jgi:Type IV secretion-system coupling protein DNA-binding domain